MGKYDRWAAFFEDLDGDRHEIPLEVLDALVEGGLPPTAMREKAWWSGEHYYASWRKAGWYASLQPKAERVVFSKVPFARGRPAASVPPRRPEQRASPAITAITPPDEQRLVLVGCVAQKRGVVAPARDLYVSTLWEKRRRYAESTHMPWFVLSAEHGLVDPDEMLEPYDRYLEKETRDYRERWSAATAARVVERCRALGRDVVEVHAGSAYLEHGLIEALRRAGIAVRWPLRGLRIGEQLGWYDRVAVGHPPAPVRSPSSGWVAPAAVVPSAAHAKGIAELYRSGVLGESWSELPEVWQLPAADPTAQRLWLTFVAAVDRARDAASLWRAAHTAWTTDRWLFDPPAIVERSFTELADVLRRHGVSQRHMPDAAAWRAIAEALVSPGCPPPVREAVWGRPTVAREVLAAVGETWPHGTPMFPLLSGPKIGPMWVRILAYPGGSPISGLDIIPVAVDTHVQRVTEMLGLVPPRTLDDAHRIGIQSAWFEAVKEAGKFGAPPVIDGTAAGLDPALWAMGKEACSRCEREARKLVVGAICDLCVLGRVRPEP